MNLHSISLHVANTNIIAIKCYKKNNFKIIRNNHDDNNKLFGYTLKLNFI